MPELAALVKAYAGSAELKRAYVGDTHVAEMYTNLATNPSFEASSGTVELWRNLATNPSFEASGGTVEVYRNLVPNPSFEVASSTIEVRRNLFPVPRPAAANATFVSMTASTGTTDGPAVAPTQYWRGTASAALTTSGVDTTANATTTVTGTKVLSAWVRSSVAHSVNLTAIGAGATGVSSVSQPTVALTANTWAQVTFIGTFSATGLVGVRVRNVGAVSLPIGATFDIGAIMVEDVPVVLPFFDGVASPDTDLTASWLGTVNNSVSILSGLPLTPGGNTNSISIQSAQWASTGTKSLRLMPLSATVDSRTLIAGSGSSLAGQGVTFVPGKTYTAMAKFRQAAPQSGTLWSEARKIQAVMNGTGGTTTSAQATNTAGVQQLSITFTVPADATIGYVRLHNGTSLGNGDVWWDDILIIEGTYTGSYFDGSTSPDTDLTAAWTGTANASASVLNGTGVTSTAHGQLAGVSSTQWASSGVKSFRQIPNTTGNSSNSRVAGSSGGLSGSGVTFVAGQTYTIQAKLRLPVPQAGSLNANARRISVTYNGTGGVSVYSSQAPNVAGVTTLTVTFTLPADATLCDVLLWNGATSTNGETWWDDLLIVQGTYVGPYFDGANRAKVRRNLATDPAATSITTWSSIGPTPTTRTVDSTIFHQGSSAVRVTATGAGVMGAKATTPISLLLTGGQTVKWSVWVYSSVAASFQPYWERSTPYTGGPGGATVAVPAATWTKIEGSITFTPAQAAGTSFGFGLLSITSFAIGGYIVADEALVEITTGPLGAYFDGATPIAPYAAAWDGTANASASYLYDGDLANSWTGTANASASILTAARVTTFGGTVGTGYSSTVWAQTGVASLVIDNKHTGGVSYSEVALSQLYPGGLAAIKGRTFTALATVRNDGVVSLPSTNNARIIMARFYGSASPNAVSAYPAAGIQVVRLTFTVPNDATECSIRLHGLNSNDTNPDGRTWWDCIAIVEGPYTTGIYFDGSTPAAVGHGPAAWTGTPNASASKMWSMPTP